MADILMFTDTPRYNERLRLLSVHHEDFNLILGDYNALGLPALTASEFLSLLNNPRELVFDKMTNGQPLTLNGLPVSRAKAFEMVTFPAGFDYLVEIITGFKNANPGWNQSVNIEIVNGVIVLSQAAKDTEANASKYYAKTADEKAVYGFAQDVIAAAASWFGDANKVHIPFLVSAIISNATGGNGNEIAARAIAGIKKGSAFYF